MRQVGLAYPAGEALAQPLERLLELAARAGGLGFGSLWLLGSDLEQARVLPLTLAAMAAAPTDLTLGLRLVAYDHPVRVAEDLSVLDNVLEGRLGVAFLPGGRAGDGVGGSGLSRLRAIADLLDGGPIALAGGGVRGTVAVSPPPKRQPLVPSLWLEEDAQASDVLRAVRAGVPAIVPHRLARALPRIGPSRGLRSLVEVLAAGDDLRAPLPAGASARVVTASFGGAEAEEIAARLKPEPGAPSSPARQVVS